ncbi:MAG: hypothetical protein JWM27_821 [Gemmatimonadetes bacterium]|nr:hypothetical protein [Gemmatimonadota bacterium]
MRSIAQGMAALALACTALAACDGRNPADPSAATPHSFCQVNRAHADCNGPPPRDPPPDTTTPPPPAASYAYSLIHLFYVGGSGLKTAEVGAESDSYAYVNYTLADAYITAANCYTNVNTSTVHKIKSGYGSPFYAAAGFQQLYPNNSTVIKWKISATHTFTPVAGATGGGTYSTYWEGCY